MRDYSKLNFSCIDVTHFHLPEEGKKFSETGRDKEEFLTGNCVCVMDTKMESPNHIVCWLSFCDSCICASVWYLTAKGCKQIYYLNYS